MMETIETNKIMDDILSVYNNNFKRDGEDKERLILWLLNIYIKDYINMDEIHKQNIKKLILSKL
jgi:hypothetical protein